jgi:hypothetical protein
MKEFSQTSTTLAGFDLTQNYRDALIKFTKQALREYSGSAVRRWDYLTKSDPTFADDALPQAINHYNLRGWARFSGKDFTQKGINTITVLSGNGRITRYPLIRYFDKLKVITPERPISDIHQFVPYTTDLLNNEPDGSILNNN